MRIQNSLRRKLIFAILIGCFIPYCIGGIYLKAYVQDGLYELSIENSKQAIQQVCELIDKALINDMKEEVSLLAALNSVKDVETGINNYTNFTSDQFTYTDYASENTIAEFFQVFKENHDTMNFVFLGTESGGYMEYPQFMPKKSYDPRVRPWYSKTIGQEDIVISEPYITNVTNEIVVSFTKQVKNKDKAIGVVGVSVSLHDLANSIRKIKVGDSGYLLVLSPERRFIVSPNNKDWTLKTPEELGISGLSEENLTIDDSMEIEIDGNLSVINSVTDENGWHIISVIPKEEITHKGSLITNILICIYGITFVVIFTIIFIVTNRITKPILEISNVIKRMTKFDFSSKSNLRGYTNRTDEIGIVSNALLEMQDNFYELMGQVDLIDDEIRNIDIESNSRSKLELSSNNPFYGVMNSINTLLDNIYLYFGQLKAKNYEIVAKNDQLTSTEEELIAQLEEINQQKEYINFLAYHDPLTELPNRRKFTEHIAEQMQAGHKGAVILLDLDDFKGINDIRGHAFGDRVLETIARRFDQLMDDNIFISRFGGDEFLFYIKYETDKNEVEKYVSKISNLFSDKIRIDEIEIDIKYSMGIALYPEDTTDINQLIMDADMAMYEVKNTGKNGYKFFDSSMMDYQIKISNILSTIKASINNDAFKLVYQPKIEVSTGKIIGYEALLRHKEIVISPAEYIGVAEKNGLIIAIGRIVAEKVIRQLYEWKRMGLELKPVSFNFSANQLPDSGFINFLQERLKQYQIMPEYLEIEITENIVFENEQVTKEFLSEIQSMGIKIAIDDFGTGYSSLNYLTFLPVNIIKLDRSLNMRFLEIKNAKMMNCLISLIHSLGLSVVAEGVETMEHVQALKKVACDYVQGYYFSKPLDADQIPLINDIIYQNY